MTIGWLYSNESTMIDEYNLENIFLKTALGMENHIQGKLPHCFSGVKKKHLNC